MQLLHWSASINLAERYERNGSNSNEIFYNCSLPWFGSMCEYRFDFDILLPFSNIVQFLIDNPDVLRPINDSACYSFLTSCYRGPSPTCLDSREICDDKYDCLNGEDEESCNVLEMNECSANEYRYSTIVITVDNVFQVHLLMMEKVAQIVSMRVMKEIYIPR